MSEATTVLVGSKTYQVEKLGEKGISPAYRITSPRGVIYMLLRNKPNPHMLFAINETNFLKGSLYKKWFTDKDGTLKYCG